jgi:hypothetical protein
MRKCLFFAFLLCASVPALSHRTGVLIPQGYKINADKMISFPATKDMVIDTLTANLIPPFYWWPSTYRKEYEATQFSTQSPCSILAVMHAVGSEKAATKQCSLFIWDNAVSSPGNRLLSTEVTATLDSAGVNWVSYVLPTPLYVTTPFWVGNYEMDTLFPTSIFDTLVSLPSKYNDGSGWQDDGVDYLHAAIVKCDSGTSEGIRRVVVMEEFTATG